MHHLQNHESLSWDTSDELSIIYLITLPCGPVQLRPDLNYDAVICLCFTLG